MKKLLVILAASIFAFSTLAFAGHHADTKDAMKKEMKMKMDEKVKVQPNNIDKHNVGITKNEKLDQTDPTLIEGNLEDNDFKN